MKVTVCWNPCAVDGVQPAPRVYHDADSEAVKAEICSGAVFAHTVEVRGVPAETARWERIYAAAFANIILQEKNALNALHDERVIRCAKVLAKQIADEGANE